MDNKLIKQVEQSAIITFPSHIFRLDHLKMYYLEVPAEIVQKLGGLKCGRLICTVNSTLSFQCGLMALGSGSAYISINCKRMKALSVRLGDAVTVLLEKDESEYGTEMPEELAELLLQDEEGNRRFNLLKPGMQRYILQYVTNVKSSQLRIDRAILLLENLKRSHPDKVIFRELIRRS